MLPIDPVNNTLFYYLPHGLPSGYFLTTWDKIKFIAGFGFCIGYLCRMLIEVIRKKYFPKPKIDNIKGDEDCKVN